MAWVAVNRITVESPAEADRVIDAFRHRAGKVDLQPGFRSLEVWREEEGKEVLVSTRWDTKEQFRAWVNGPAFQEAHRTARGGPGSAHGTVYEVVL